MAWVVVSQKPNLMELLRKLHVQLSHDPLPESAAGDADAAFQVLQQFCLSRCLLVILDDVWDSAIEKSLSFLDESTNSRMLISTRIRGLVAGAREIQVQLLSNQEAVSMLCAMAELDAATVPSSVMSIIRLCGNLPLCLGIVAGKKYNHSDGNL
jgi:hypothetical protein